MSPEAALRAPNRAEQNQWTGATGPIEDKAADRYCAAMVKVGRNQLCPCGSGLKYKKCHGGAARPQTGPLPLEVLRALRNHEAAEKVRTEQQGYGQSIISFTSHNYRIVAVGDRIFWSKSWLFFTDFLLHFLKETLNPEWGAREQAKGEHAHPLLRWFAKFPRYREEHAQRNGTLNSGPKVGFVAGILHLAYALYLLAHHDEIPKLLLRRLRDPVMFLPAYYELLVGAAFAVAGFSISAEERRASSSASPEFRVTSRRTRRSYAVEAKFRAEPWKSTQSDVRDAAFRDEVGRYLRAKFLDASDQLRRASQADEGQVIWIELSIPNVTTEEQWRVVADLADSVISAAEKAPYRDGTQRRPAYVFVTNHTFLADEDHPAAPIFAYLLVPTMPGRERGQPLEIEEALEHRESHRDIIWVAKCLKIATTIPTTFDGSPAELLDGEGRPVPALRIGTQVAYRDDSGQERAGIIEDLTSIQGEGITLAFVKDDADGLQRVIPIPLTEHEAKAVTRFGDSVFGKPNASRGLSDEQPFDLYDWLLDAYKNTKREDALRMLADHPEYALYEALSLPDLRIRLCRELTKSMWSRKVQSADPTTE